MTYETESKRCILLENRLADFFPTQCPSVHIVTFTSTKHAELSITIHSEKAQCGVFTVSDERAIEALVREITQEPKAKLNTISAHADGRLMITYGWGIKN